MCLKSKFILIRFLILWNIFVKIHENDCKELRWNKIYTLIVLFLLSDIASYIIILKYFKNNLTKLMQLL